MAKRSNEPIPSQDKAKVRVFFAELEGNNDSVQEALKTMVSAMSRPVKIISDQRNPILLDKADIEEAEEPVEQVAEHEVSSDGAVIHSAKKPRGTGKKVDRNAGLRLVPDLDFRPNGKKALKDFVDNKLPSNDIQVVLVIVYYMQHIMESSKIGPSHIRTAFKEIGKPVPADLKQTVRNVQSSRMWLKFTDIEDIKTTTQGDNFVEHDMGKSD